MSGLAFDREAASERLPLARELTPRERCIVELLEQGYTQKQIARALGISQNTVGRHVENISDAIPGDMPRMARVIAWARGAGRRILERSTHQLELV